jgi:hypothetical protein
VLCGPIRLSGLRVPHVPVSGLVACRLSSAPVFTPDPPAPSRSALPSRDGDKWAAHNTHPPTQKHQ